VGKISFLTRESFQAIELIPGGRFVYFRGRRVKEKEKGGGKNFSSTSFGLEQSRGCHPTAGSSAEYGRGGRRITVPFPLTA